MIEEVNDYAMPAMMAEKALMAVHWYDEAMDKAWKALEATKDIHRAKMKEFGS